ncbi:MAG: cell division protein FtsH, partial [Chloroflexota bacterium]
FLGREISESRNYSDKVAEEIDEEVRQIIEHAYQTAKRLLTEHKDKLDAIVTAVMEQETIEGESLMQLLTGTGAPGQMTPEEDLPKTEKQSPEPQRPPNVAPPKPGLAWDAPAHIDPPVD